MWAISEIIQSFIWREKNKHLYMKQRKKKSEHILESKRMYFSLKFVHFCIRNFSLKFIFFFSNISNPFRQKIRISFLAIHSNDVIIISNKRKFLFTMFFVSFFYWTTIFYEFVREEKLNFLRKKNNKSSFYFLASLFECIERKFFCSLSDKKKFRWNFEWIKRRRRSIFHTREENEIILRIYI